MRERSLRIVLIFFGTPSAEHQAGFSGFQVEVAELSERDGGAELITLVGGILAIKHLRQLELRTLTRLLRRQGAERADLQPALPTAARSKIDDEGLKARRENADAEALQLAVPEHRAVLGAVRLQPVDDALSEFRHANQPFGRQP